MNYLVPQNKNIEVEESLQILENDVNRIMMINDNMHHELQFHSQKTGRLIRYNRESIHKWLEDHKVGGN